MACGIRSQPITSAEVYQLQIYQPCTRVSSRMSVFNVDELGILDCQYHAVPVCRMCFGDFLMCGWACMLSINHKYKDISAANLSTRQVGK